MIGFGFAVLVVVTVVLVVAALVLTRWAGKRGWIYNKHNPRPAGSGVPMMLDELYQPSIEHVIEEQSSEAIRADQTESGDKPNSE